MAGWSVALAAGVLAVLVLVALGVLIVGRSRPPAPAPTVPVVPATRRSTRAHPAVRGAAGRTPTGPPPAAARHDPAPVRRRVPRDLAAAPGTVLLLQFSAAFCTASRDTRAVLADAVGERGDHVHTRDVDVANRPELVDRLDVASTPTTLLVDAHGAELARLRGVPRRAAVAAALRDHLPA